MMKKLVVIIGVMLVISGWTQNLVPNFSFEQKSECPPDFVTFYRKLYMLLWDSPNLGTPDYFNACAGKCGVPSNWVGIANAYSGQAYAGIIACLQQYDPKQVAYREYLRIKLTDSLIAGESYFASMKVRLAQSSIASCNGLGMYFSSIPMTSNSNINYPVKADITFSDNKAPKDKEKWISVCGQVVAQGGEQYLLIGNFLSNQQMEYIQFDENLIAAEQISPMAYFYIDHVEVYHITGDSTYSCDAIAQNNKSFSGDILLNEKLVLNHLYFETDKSTILTNSFYELNQLVGILTRYPQLKIAIYGHTDNIGSTIHNQQLSDDRAKAVRNYLIEKGVSPMRISFYGLGDSKPVDSNATEQGRSKNRRVEIEITK